MSTTTQRKLAQSTEEETIHTLHYVHCIVGVNFPAFLYVFYGFLCFLCFSIGTDLTRSCRSVLPRNMVSNNHGFKPVCT